MNRTKNRKPRRYKGERESLHTVMLCKISANHLEFYLDEIREHLYRMGGGWWATSTIWKKLTHNLGYSLQVATDRAFEIDEEERQEYMDELMGVIVHPRQLVFFMKLQKGKILADVDGYGRFAASLHFETVILMVMKENNTR